MTTRTKDLESALLKKGFEKFKSKHNKYIYCHEGERTGVWTCGSHGDKELRDTLESLVRKQMRLTKREFKEFVKCPLTAEDYREILLTNKHIP